MVDELDEQVVAKRLLANDQEAVRDIYRAYGSMMLTVAFRVLGNKVDAEDAVQQALLQFWKSRASIDPSMGFRRLLFAITKRVAYDVSKRERIRAHPELTETNAGTVDGDEGLRHWEAGMVRSAVDQLPPDEREVIRLQHFEGFTHTQIATKLGVPPGTVKSRSHRAHERLLRSLRALNEQKGDDT